MRFLSIIIAFLTFILFFFQEIKGQDWQVDSVLITAASLREEALGGDKQSWKDAELDLHRTHLLSDFFSAQSGIYIKSYGMGSLATSSVRGGSAGHTLVLWNGLPLMSPMLGQLDLSLLPLGSFDRLSFQKGGNSALWGSGAIGGMISLESDKEVESGFKLEARASLGSFGNRQEQIELSVGNKHFRSRSKILVRKADNDFPFQPAPGLPLKNQSNARLKSNNFLQDLQWRLSPQDRLSFHLWLQESQRQIPPTLVQRRSEARQKDEALRLMTTYRHVGEKIHWKAKTSFFDEKLSYFDDLILLESISRFQTLQADVSGNAALHPDHHLEVGSTHALTRAWSSGYKDIPAEYRASLFAAWRWDAQPWKLQASLRQQWMDSRWLPLIPALGLVYEASPSLRFRLKASRNFRLPTLNDRFWRPGGNLDLLPEIGWSQEAGLNYSFSLGQWTSKFEIAAFSRRIDNWILWTIKDGQSYWSANNVERVWSRGVEPRWTLIFAKKDWRMKMELGYDFIRSTSQFSLELPSIQAGDQLIYTPIHQGNARLSFHWKKLQGYYQHTYTGATQGINDPLPAFQTADALLSHAFEIGKLQGEVFGEVKNIWNVRYQIIERRPMPGIHYQAGINLLLHKNAIQ